MRTVTLRELLPAEALRKIEDLIQAGTCDVVHLKPILKPYQADLLKKGVDADYLAHSVANAATWVDVKPTTKFRSQ